MNADADTAIKALQLADMAVREQADIHGLAGRCVLHAIVAAYEVITTQARVITTLQRENDALREELDLLRARAPREYIMTRKAEWLRMFREAAGFLHTCRRQHHGTDLHGRRHVIDALEAAMKELGEPEGERHARQIAELRADETAARAQAQGGAEEQQKEQT